MSILSDTVTRADTTSGAGTTDTGQVWQDVIGGSGVDTGKLYFPTLSSGEAISLIHLTTNSPDCFMQTAVYGRDGTVYAGVIVRDDGTGLNHYLAQIAPSDGSVSIYKRISGSYGSPLITSVGQTWADGDVLGLLVEGNGLYATKNGAGVAAIADNSILTGDYVGLRQGYLGAATLRFDNIVCDRIVLSVHDDFTGSDSAPGAYIRNSSDLHVWNCLQVPLVANGTMWIESNRVRLSDNNYGALAYTPSSVNDALVTVDFGNLGVNDFAGVCCRITTSKDFYLAQYDPTGPAFQLYKQTTAGGWTGLASYSPGAVTSATIGIRHVAGTLYGYWNGAQVLSVGDSDFNTNYAQGFRLGSGGANQTWFDNYSSVSLDVLPIEVLQLTDHGGTKLTNLPDPVDAQDPLTKGYLDAKFTNALTVQYSTPSGSNNDLWASTNITN